MFALLDTTPENILIFDKAKENLIESKNFL